MNFSTAISSIAGAIGGAARAVTPAVQALLPAFAPMISTALMPQPRTGHYSGGGGGMPRGVSYSAPYTASYALPGGALVAQQQHPGIFSRGMDTLLGGANPYGPGMALSTGAPSSGPGARMPHLMQVPHARGDGSVVTYVRAPAVAYSVSIRRKGGRCRKGR